MKASPKVLALIVSAGVAGFVLAGCQYGSSTSTSPQTQQSAATTSEQSANAVTIANMAFTPKDIQVKVGETVTWTNNDGFNHTVTSDTAGQFDSGSLSKGGTFSFTFKEAGKFAYHCQIHSGMTGTVTVVK